MADEKIENVTKKIQFGFNPGDLFGSRYQIIEEIGQGGMGKVFKAKDLELDEVVALKMIRPELGSSADMIARFKRELQLAREINHENVIRIHDLGEIDGIKFISMKYIQGQTLTEIIQTTGKLNIEKAIDIAKQICGALETAHGKGIVHRDLKPQNIMLDKTGKVYVMDFGIARSISGTTLTDAKVMLGTLDFMAPEQLLGKRIDIRTDIWSFGIVFYEMVTGKLPFKKDYPEALAHFILNERPVAPAKLNPQVPKELEKLIMKCLEKKPENRFASAREISTALQVNVDKKIKRKKNKKKKKILVYASLFLLFIALAIVALNFYMPLIRKKFAKEPEAVKPPPVETSVITEKERNYQKYFEEAKNYYKEGQLENALRSINLAEIGMTTPELAKLKELVQGDLDKAKAEEERKNQEQAQAALARQQQVEQEKQRLAGEEAKKQLAEQERLKRGAEEAKRQQAEKERQRQEELARAEVEKKKQEEAQRLKAEEERQQQEKEQQRLQQEQESKRLEELARAGLEKKNQEEAQRLKAEEERQRKAEEEKKRAEPQIGQVWKERITGMQFVYVPAGGLLLGSENGEADEKPVHRVELDGFWLEKCEVTQGQWGRVMGSTPASFQKGNDYPVERVSWDETQEFIRRLNQLTGLVFRLPTEAEWEYACRAGTAGDTSGYGRIDQAAWYYDNSSEQTHAVGQKKANAWGLFDMLGNVGEWCQDWYDPGYYAKSPSRNPTGPAAGERRVYRGGSWVNRANMLRASIRLHQVPSTKRNNLGIRLAANNK